MAARLCALTLLSCLVSAEYRLVWNPYGKRSEYEPDSLMICEDGPFACSSYEGSSCDNHGSDGSAHPSTFDNCKNCVDQLKTISSKPHYSYSTTEELTEAEGKQMAFGCMSMLIAPPEQLPPPVPEAVPVEPPVDPPRVAKPAERQVTSVIANVAAVTSVTAANTLAATQAAKLKTFMALARCPPDTDSQELDFLDSPTGLGRRGKSVNSPMTSRRFMMLGNIAVLTTAIVAHFVLACAHYLWKTQCGSSMGFRHSLAVLRFPSFSLFPFMVLFQPIATPAFTLLYYVSSLWDMLLSIGALGYLLMICTYLKWRIHDSRFPCHLADNDATSKCDAWMFGIQSWSSRGIDGNRFERRFSLMFKDFKFEYRWFTLVDLAVLTAIGAVAAIVPQDRTQCAVQAFVMVCAELGFVVIIIYFHPFLAPFDHWHTIAVAIAQVIGLLLALCAILLEEPSGGWATGSRYFLLFSTLLVVIKSILDVFHFVYERCQHRRARVKNEDPNNTRLVDDSVELMKVADRVEDDAVSAEGSALEYTELEGEACRPDSGCYVVSTQGVPVLEGSDDSEDTKSSRAMHVLSPMSPPLNRTVQPPSVPRRTQRKGGSFTPLMRPDLNIRDPSSMSPDRALSPVSPRRPSPQNGPLSPPSQPLVKRNSGSYQPPSASGTPAGLPPPPSPAASATAVASPPLPARRELAQVGASRAGAGQRASSVSPVSAFTNRYPPRRGSVAYARGGAPRTPRGTSPMAPVHVF
ncbi:hypothetical protein DIPPA_35634 [Diplonema papillatum]|nr:hypothetical protein DIPPA_35634 [Diplonema papillatum]